MPSRAFVAALAFVLLAACQDRAGQGPAQDHFTYSNPQQFLSRHLFLDLAVDMQQSAIEGAVRHRMSWLDSSSRRIVMDSRGLEVRSVQWLEEDGAAIDLDFLLGETDSIRGEPLAITLPEHLDYREEIEIRIHYRTGPGASALMWIPAQLTAGGRYPLMFTQSQSIHARSWIPLQDTPAVRVTYQAEIRTPPGLRALMSANNDPASPLDGRYRFDMPQAIPSYLMALAVGEFRFAPFGPDTGVYAEPELLDAAAWEFTDTQDMLDAAETTYGPYRWGRYDLLVLPPSFPYGGMENPRLSFITPSLLAGDRSLVSVIAHELAHSWSGNLVSNRSWRDVWLNEGMTSYVESRLMEQLYGKDRADEERMLTWLTLQQKLETVPENMQPLAPIFTRGDPDVGQQGLEYAKGQWFMETLEKAFGREVFDPFLAGYFDHFAFQAISSEQFLEYTDRFLLQAHPGQFSRQRLEEWLYRPGLPAGAKPPRSRNLELAATQAAAWARGELAVDKLSVNGSSPQWLVYFIRTLPTDLSLEQLTELDQALGLSQSDNAEVARAWFVEVARRRFEPAYPATVRYLQRTGRTYLVQPVYEALVANGADRGRAREWFERSRSQYHPLTRRAIEDLFIQTNE